MAASESRENDSREEYPKERAERAGFTRPRTSFSASIPATTLAGAREEAWVKRIFGFLKEPPPTSHAFACDAAVLASEVSFLLASP